MQTSSIETTLGILKKDLEDVKARIDQRGNIYRAYKENTLSAGIYTLEGLGAEAQLRNNESINALLAQYRQTYQTILQQ